MRPLLGVTREQTAAHCVARGLQWREDSSNEGGRFARGRIRHEVLPALASVHPAAAENIARTIEILRAESAVLDEVVEVALAGRSRIALAHLGALPGALARLVVIRLAEDAAGAPWPEWVRASRSCSRWAPPAARGRSTSGAGCAPSSSTASCASRARTRAHSRPAAGELGLPGGVRVRHVGAASHARGGRADAPARAAQAGEVGMFDADRLGARALTVRSWRAGDRMRPLGLAGSKSLADLFGARRVPREARAGVPVLIAGARSSGSRAWPPRSASASTPDTRALAVLHAVRR